MGDYVEEMLDMNDFELEFMATLDDGIDGDNFQFSDMLEDSDYFPEAEIKFVP